TEGWRAAAGLCRNQAEDCSPRRAGTGFRRAGAADPWRGGLGQPVRDRESRPDCLPGDCQSRAGGRRNRLKTVRAIGWSEQILKPFCPCILPSSTYDLTKDSWRRPPPRRMPRRGADRTQRSGRMAGSTFTWIGNSGSALPADDPLDWSPSGPPHGGDSAIINAGTLLFTDAGIQPATIYLDRATLEFFGTGSTTPQNPTLDSATVITSNVSAAETPSATPTQ